METLQLGQYKIPEGKVATISHGILIIREYKVKPITGKKCRDCKYIGSGHATDTDYWTTCVCLKKPKTVKNQKSRSQIYFAANPTGKICEMFELKDR